jgi:hypothetical protein
VCAVKIVAKSLTEIDQKRMLEFEIYKVVLGERYKKNDSKEIVLSQNEVIAKYYAKYPDIKDSVDAH